MYIFFCKLDISPACPVIQLPAARATAPGLMHTCHYRKKPRMSLIASLDSHVQAPCPARSQLIGATKSADHPISSNRRRARSAFYGSRTKTRSPPPSTPAPRFSGTSVQPVPSLAGPTLVTQPAAHPLDGDRRKRRAVSAPALRTSTASTAATASEAVDSEPCHIELATPTLPAAAPAAAPEHGRQYVCDYRKNAAQPLRVQPYHRRLSPAPSGLRGF